MPKRERKAQACPERSRRDGKEEAAFSASIPDNRIHDAGYAYDANGNLARKPAPAGAFETFRYDALNRLLFSEIETQLSDGSVARRLTGSNFYDADNARVIKGLSGLGLNETRFYSRVGSQTLREWKLHYVIEEGDPSPESRTAALVGDREYIYGPDGMTAQEFYCGPRVDIVPALAPIVGGIGPGGGGGQAQNRVRLDVTNEAAGATRQVLWMKDSPDGTPRVAPLLFAGTIATKPLRLFGADIVLEAALVGGGTKYFFLETRTACPDIGAGAGGGNLSLFSPEIAVFVESVSCARYNAVGDSDYNDALDKVNRNSFMVTNWSQLQNLSRTKRL